jgi:hypothetical protein
LTTRPQAEETPPEQPEAPEKPFERLQAPPPLLNTPVQHGQMLRGYKPETPIDPWAVVKPRGPELPKVKPGAKIKFGSGSSGV